MLPLLRDDGWYLVATRGSHRQFKHRLNRAESPSQGSPAMILLPGRSAVFLSRLVSSSEEYMRYAVVIERAQDNYSAYVLDLPGCVATGATMEETEELIREAIDLLVSGLREDGLPIPKPHVKSSMSRSRPNEGTLTKVNSSSPTFGTRSLIMSCSRKRASRVTNPTSDIWTPAFAGVTMRTTGGSHQSDSDH
jgi:predicted RNase H-like HicB family nuclease